MKTSKLGFAVFLSIAFIFASSLTIFAEESKSTEVPTDALFTDISNKYWAKNEIMQLVEMGILAGDRDMQFRPNAPVTVKEANLALSKVFQTDVLLKGGQVGYVSEGKLKIFLESIDSTTTQPSEAYKPIIKHTLHTSEFLTRATFAVILHDAMVEKGYIKESKKYSLQNVAISDNYPILEDNVNLTKVSFDEHPIYLRSLENIKFINHERIDNDFSRDNIYTYKVGVEGATITLTVRSFDNGDYFLFSKINNPTITPITVDVIQKENYVTSTELYRYDRYEIKRSTEDVFGQDITSYPTGLLRFVKEDGTVEERMVGKSYQSKQLYLDYPDGGESFMRELLGEYEALSYAQVGSTIQSIHSLQSDGEDIVEQWYMDAVNQLFVTDEHMENWMLESSQYYKKRNKWYTAEGQYNKMATTTEPMPESGLGYGRILLLQKEDRALVLYKQQKDRYFENLIYNSFVNLKNFKGDKEYWETEVTSTYLKNLYDITAPFIDTRFNEQIALFYYNSADEFGIDNGNEPLRNYADLLVSQKEKGNVLKVDEESYYIADYFPIIQDVTTHASMNHVLGGMNILLMAYEEFGDEKYLNSALAVQTAIEKDKKDWIRDNGDIWYRINKEREYKGDDYKHLTLEDLITSYKLWSKIDSTHLPLLEEMIASKSSYLSTEQLGYTTKIKSGLQDIGLLQYLPTGNERTDAL